MSKRHIEAKNLWCEAHFCFVTACPPEATSNYEGTKFDKILTKFEDFWKKTYWNNNLWYDNFSDPTEKDP